MVKRHARSKAFTSQRSDDRWSFSRSFHHAQPLKTRHHQTDDVSDLSCKDRTCQYGVDDREATHNRSVAGSRPASPTEQGKRTVRWVGVAGVADIAGFWNHGRI